MAALTGSNYKLHMRLYIRPLLFAYENNSDFPACEVLLIPDVFVGGQKNFKSRCFGRVQQVAVLQLVPSFASGGANGVAG